MNMKMRSLLLLTSSVVTVALCAPTTLAAQKRDPAMEGVWRYVSEIDRRADGSIVQTSGGAGYDGILIFTANGYMSSTLTIKGRTWRFARVTPAQMRETLTSSSAHAGHYVPDSITHIVRMENLVTIDPADEGHWDTIQYRATGDTLELSGPWLFNGEKLTFTLRLARAK